VKLVLLSKSTNAIKIISKIEITQLVYNGRLHFLT